MTAMVRRLVVVGVGLIGGSFAKACVKHRLAEEVIGVAHRPETRQLAMEAGVVDRVVDSCESVVTALDARDMVLLALPPRLIPSVLPLLAAQLDPEVTLTDVASTKGFLLDAVRCCWGYMPANFVPGHPIAGSEKQGVSAANEALFQNHRVILTPTDSTDNRHLLRVTTLWEALGAFVDLMDADHHDEVLAATSHLPHLLAYTLVDTLFSLEQQREIFRYAAGGFRDFTRIAASDAGMWRDIILTNKAAVLKQLHYFYEHLQQVEAAISSDDSDALFEILSRSQEARRLFGEQFSAQQKNIGNP